MQNLRLTLWLFPLAFVIHDGEELLTMPGWIAAHQQVLQQLAAKNALFTAGVRNLSTTPAQVAFAIGVIFSLIIGVTLAATWGKEPGFWFKAYTVLLGVFFVHVFSHVGMTIYFREYTPGVIGAVAALVPACLYIYWRLFSARLLTLANAVFATIIGIGIALPILMTAHFIGRALGGR